MNCIRYFERHYKSDASVLEHLSQLKSDHPNRDDHLVIFANDVLLNSLDWTEKTGEWLVYQKNGTHINFLCLYVHDYDDVNDEKLYSLIKDELKS